MFIRIIDGFSQNWAPQSNRHVQIVFVRLFKVCHASICTSKLENKCGNIKSSVILWGQIAKVSDV